MTPNQIKAAVRHGIISPGEAKQTLRLVAEAARIRGALATIVHKACTRPVHVDSCDRQCALVLEDALQAGRAALEAFEEGGE